LDSRRYRAVGNAVAVPIIEWIGKRIVQVDQQFKQF
jgi:DNA (cytosine-5)-methyltransferase 1